MSLKKKCALVYQTQTRAGRNTNSFPTCIPSVKDGYRIHIALKIS